MVQGLAGLAPIRACQRPCRYGVDTGKAPYRYGDHPVWALACRYSMRVTSRTAEERIALNRVHGMRGAGDCRGCPDGLLQPVRGRERLKTIRFGLYLSRTATPYRSKACS